MDDLGGFPIFLETAILTYLPQRYNLVSKFVSSTVACVVKLEGPRPEEWNGIVKHTGSCIHVP